MVNGARLVKILASASWRINACVANCLYRFFLAAGKCINAELFLYRLAEINNRPLFRKVYRVAVYLKGLFSVRFFGYVPKEVFHERAAFFEAAESFVAFELRVILQVLARLAFVAENAANFEGLRETGDKQTLLPQFYR